MTRDESSEVVVREATDEDLSRFADLSAVARAPDAFAMIASDGRSTARAVVDPHGSSPNAGIARIHLGSELAGSRSGSPPHSASAPSGSDALGPLLEPLLLAIHDRLRLSGHRRAVVAWDTMDAAGQCLLADLGYHNSGIWPYFQPTHPSGPIEHVMGYRDPVGSVVDLVAEIAKPAAAITDA